MEVYEELVKRLRDKACRFNYDGWVDTAVLLEEAADAIGVLKLSVECWQDARNIEHHLRLLAEARVPRWISVEEKKPPLPDGEDFCYVNVIAAIKGRKESEQVRYCRANRFRDGKLERIERFVGDGEVLEVTHWMPMPEPPELHKEEKA